MKKKEKASTAADHAIVVAKEKRSSSILTSTRFSKSE
jgi:hypothetical protein